MLFRSVVQFLNFNYSNLRFTFLSELQYYLFFCFFDNLQFSLKLNKGNRGVISLTYSLKRGGKITIGKAKGAGRVQCKPCSFMSYNITLSLDPPKITRLKQETKLRILLIMVLMDQLGVRSSCDKGSKHSFASPSKMTPLHLS